MYAILGVLTLMFAGAKLAGWITWSWWLVLLPLYGPFALVLVLILFLFMVAGLVLIFEK